MLLALGVQNPIVDSPHKGPVTWNPFPCHDIIMWLFELFCRWVKWMLTKVMRHSARWVARNHQWNMAPFQYKDCHERYRESHHIDMIISQYKGIRLHCTDLQINNQGSWITVINPVLYSERGVSFAKKLLYFHRAKLYLLNITAQ